MALNLSHPMYSNRFAVDGSPNRGGEGYPKPWHCIREMEDSFEYHNDRGGSKEAVNDILDVLPRDPFGMDISSTFTAITGWLEDLDYAAYGSSEAGSSNGEYGLFPGFNVIWNTALKFHSLPVNFEFGEASFIAERFDAEAVKQKSLYSSATNCIEDDIIHKLPLDNVFHQASCSEDDIIHKLPLDNVFHQASCSENDIIHKLPLDNVFHQEHDGIVNIFHQTRDDQSVSGACPDEDCSPPHHALFFALSYLSVQDLLSTEGVCRSLRYTIKTDPLLWRNIHIDQPLNEKMNDDVLIQLTNRAQGYLQSLSLVECSRITDEGLKLVLESNPRLTKLCVPGCTRLSIDGIVDNLKTFSSFDTQRVKYLRVGGVYGVTQKHFDELKLLVASGKNFDHSPKPHFYGRDTYYLSSDDDRSIDIEVCPICQNLRLVYDCPNEDCRGNELSHTCRACTFCIQRCIQCGQCINDSVFVENFCLEYLCSDCWNHLPSQPENFSNNDALSEPDEHGEPSSGFPTHG